MSYFSNTSLRSVLGCWSLVAAAVILIPPDAAAHDELPAHHKVLPSTATQVMQAFWMTRQAKQDLASATTDDSSAAAACDEGTHLADPGTGDPYPCSGIDLQSFLPLKKIGGDRSNSAANDIWGWTAEDGREYAIIGRVFGTSFVDISEPTNPVYPGDLPTHGAFGSSWRDIKVYRDHAFIVSEANNHGMQVFDLTLLEPKNLDRTSVPVTFSETAHYNGGAASHNLFINEDSGFAYMVGNSGKRRCSGGLHMVDISTPTSPSFAGCYSGDGYTHDVQCVNYRGPDPDYQGSEICFASNEDTVTIVDVTDKSNPALIKKFGYTDASYTHQGWLSPDHRFFIFDDELDEYYGLVNNTTTRIIDVTDLNLPVLSQLGAATGDTGNVGYDSDGIYTGPSTSIDHNLYMVGGCAVQANYRSGLRIVDLRDALGVTDPASVVTELGYFDIWPDGDAAAFNGMWSSYAFFPSGNIVASGIEQGLYVLKPTFDLATDCDLPMNEAPVVNMTAPADGTSVVEGTIIDFAATVTDVEDNPDPTASWTSNLDDDLVDIDSDGDDNTLSAVLSVGTHIVTAASTDSGGVTGSDSVTVVVTPIGGGSDMHVAGLTGRWIVSTNKRWTGEVTISIETVGAPTAVADATVSGRWSDGANGGGSCTTDTSGMCSVTKGAKLGDPMTFTVNGVTHATLNYVLPGAAPTITIYDENTPSN